MKKRILIPYLLLATAVIVAIALSFRVHVLQDMVNQFNTEENTLAKKISVYENIFSKDSFLLTDDYQTAIKEYNKIAHEIGSENNGLKLRIALAKKIKNYNEQSAVNKIGQLEKDSIKDVKGTDMRAIQRYDSLNFAHEKTKIQLNRLQRQLQEKSFGEYLTFKSVKGNQMHYVGQVRNNMANGYGIAILDTGSRYKGEWKDNKRHGQGAFYWPDGEYYIGSYVNAKRTGYGTYYWPNGEKYVGYWKDDKRNGEGEFYAKDGSILTSGIWEDDKLVETEKKEKKGRR
jgi:hypothetical protein